MSAPAGPGGESGRPAGGAPAERTPVITRIVGALVEAAPLGDAQLFELVRVGDGGLFGEVIRLSGEVATVQVFEETTGLTLGEPVEGTGGPLAAELGPGLLGATLDGVGRPLERLAERTGAFIAPGATIDTLDRERAWPFEAELDAGAAVGPGDVLGTVEEWPGFRHAILVPPGVEGTISRIGSGSFTVEEPLGALEDGTPLRLSHRWPVRRPRPVRGRTAPARPFFTGQRVLDLLFPVAEGGTVVVPGGFGTGKTVIEQSLAKFGSADVVVFIGCGERGNEIAELLDEFPRIADPGSGRSIMERTVLVVNTSNMPVAAREASVYYGLTVAEYFRDAGLRVAVMADSLSRWAEALREIGSRLGELPGEEGYPTYLPNRLAQLYERAGRAEVHGRPERTGAVTFVSAVSPPGGDFSEPVTQASLRVAGALWALDASLAHQRQFPAVDWDASYSQYVAETEAWFEEEGGRGWAEARREASELLQREADLREIAGLVGEASLEDRDRLLLETGRLLREVVLGQNAFDPADERSSAAKTHALASLAVRAHAAGVAALEAGEPWDLVSAGLERVRAALRELRGAEGGEVDATAGHVRAALVELAGDPDPAEAGGAT